jgi:hypothetical protein
MPDLQKELLDKKIHPEAENLAEEYIKQFADKIVIQSKSLAILDGANEVQSNHVEKARNLVLNSIQTRSRFKEGILLLGSIMIGLGLQGIFNEYSTQKRAEWFIIYFSACLIGLILAFSVYLSGKS